MAEEQAAQTVAAQTAPAQASKGGGKALKVVALVIVLAAVIAVIALIALFGKDLFKPSGGAQVQPIQPLAGMVKVGTPGASATLNEDGAVGKVLEAGDVGDEQTGYVFCRVLNPGDKIAAMGDDARYEAAGPAWFVYVDDVPGAFFEHDVKYIFIDASTGEKHVYHESWPPDVNGEDIFEAGDSCGGTRAIYPS